MKNNYSHVDTLLKSALSSKEVPDAELTQRVKYGLAKQKRNNATVAKLSLRTVAVVVIVLMLTTTTALAAWNLLKPSEVAERFNDFALSEAFKSKDAVVVNESVTSGDYTFTLLGMVSGKDITDGYFYSDGVLRDDRTYAAVAIQKADGTPMPNMQSDVWNELAFFATPLVKGIEPYQLNVYLMDGAVAWTVLDGVLYRLVECDNIEMFANRGLYFAVGTAIDSLLPSEAFVYDEQTGEITANPDYNGACAVFDLPIDPKLGDPERAEQYLNELWP